MTDFIWHKETLILEVKPMVADPNVDAVNKAMVQFSGRSLAGGADKCPVVDWIGNGTSWDVKPSPWRKDETFIVFKFDKLQVLQVREDTPAYPYDTLELSIKHSGSLRSVFGFMQNSINQALGKESSDSDIDDFLNHTWHVQREMHNWGMIDGKPDQMGEIWKFSLVAAPVPASSSSPVPVADITAPDASTLTASIDEQTPEQRALELLDGKSRDQFFPEVTVDAKVRENAPLFMSIIQQTWLAEKIASGQVTVNEADGIHTVVKA